VLSPPHARTLAITFDDAFLSVRELALPILSRLGLPATVFAPTAFMAHRQRLHWPGIEQWIGTASEPELQCMDWKDLRALVDHGWEIGSHTCTHPRLTEVDDDDAAAELQRSRRDCEEHLGCRCSAVAYPYGDVDDRIADAAVVAGYAAGAALASNLRGLGAHRRPRVGIYHRDGRWRFWLKVNGAVRRMRASPLWPARD